MDKVKEILDKIRIELEAGIKRNNVLPLDWAMDRIEPIIKEYLNNDLVVASSENNSQETKSITSITQLSSDSSPDTFLAKSEPTFEEKEKEITKNFKKNIIKITKSRGNRDG